ncbi:hypothetical protein D3C80_2218220 [compost metagenome]
MLLQIREQIKGVIGGLDNKRLIINEEQPVDIKYGIMGCNIKGFGQLLVCLNNLIE